MSTETIRLIRDGHKLLCCTVLVCIFAHFRVPFFSRCCCFVVVCFGFSFFFFSSLFPLLTRLLFYKGLHAGTVCVLHHASDTNAPGVLCRCVGTVHVFHHILTRDKVTETAQGQ